MKILVTGANGFIAKNLIAELHNQGFDDILEFDKDSTLDLLDSFTQECQFVFHLAGINRPTNPEDFMSGNFGFSSSLLDKLKKNNNKSPLVVSSSIQVELDNLYGKSKKAADDILLNYANETNNKVYIYRLPNVFGKWCRPNYNSVVATFCHNIARELPIQINDPETLLNLVYIDDVIFSFINLLKNDGSVDGYFQEISPVYNVKLGDLSELIYSFKSSRENLLVPDMGNEFIKKLYSTYLSYLPEDKFSYILQSNTDLRGSFTEFIRTLNHGQVSVNISKPGIVKGNHWHHTKNEKFWVIQGKAVIRFRNINSDKIIEYFVSDNKFEVLDIPVGYTHQIENLGENDLITIMWANELFNIQNPDTYYLNV